MKQTILWFFVFCTQLSSAQFNPVLIKDINPGEKSSYPMSAYSYQNKLFFSANSGNGWHMWVSDGSESGTQQFHLVEPSSFTNNSAFTEVNNRMYFCGGFNGDRELWVSDGTQSGTQLLKSINSGGNSDPRWITPFGNSFFFTADNGVNGRELWFSDGTENGTKLVLDINQGADESKPENLVVHNNLLYFSAGDGSEYPGLWVSDGTSAGTKKVYTSLTKAHYPGEVFLWSGQLKFLAKKDPITVMMFHTDGTAAGTVEDFTYTRNRHYSGKSAKLGKLFFTAGGANSLFESNGLDSNLNELLDKEGNLVKSPNNFYESSNGRVFFTAQHPQYGREPYVTDGTASGTFMLHNIHPSHYSNPNFYIEYHNKIYFTANDSIGIKMWETDGTQGGTKVLVKAGSPALSPFGSIFQIGFTKWNDSLILMADFVNPSPNPELYKYGTAKLPNRINPVNGNLAFILSPNPTRNKTTLRLTNELDQTAQIFITNLSGQTLISSQFETHTLEQTIDVSGIAKGIYLVQLQTSHGTIYQQKCVVY